MGSSGSKAARAATGSTMRKYPSRPSPASQATTNAPSQRPIAAANHQPGPTVRPQAQASGSRDEAINLDASDPDFARSLRQLGAVQPSPTLSASSTFNPQFPSTPSSSSSSTRGRTQPPIGPDPRSNPALAVLSARSAIQDQAEREFLEAGRRGHAGREFLDVSTIRQVLLLRDEKGVQGVEIERRLGLRAGVVKELGGSGVVGVSS